MALRLLKRCKWWYNYDMDSKRNGEKNITAVFASQDVDTLNVFKIERIEE